MSNQVNITKSQMDKLSAKLRVPIHISYIANYIIKEDIETTRIVLKSLKEEGIIEESNHAKEYYVIKSNKI